MKTLILFFASLCGLFAQSGNGWFYNPNLYEVLDFPLVAHNCSYGAYGASGNVAAIRCTVGADIYTRAGGPHLAPGCVYSRVPERRRHAWFSVLLYCRQPR